MEPTAVVGTLGLVLLCFLPGALFRLLRRVQPLRRLAKLARRG